MFSIARLYNPACSYATNTIRINHIMMSIVLYQYKILKEKNFDNYFYYDSNDIDNTILKSEIEKLNNFSSVLRKQNQELFREMLQSSYKYSNAINAKGEEYSTESLIMSLLLERYK
jgi:hypothetical protein